MAPKPEFGFTLPFGRNDRASVMSVFLGSLKNARLNTFWNSIAENFFSSTRVYGLIWLKSTASKHGALNVKFELRGCSYVFQRSKDC